MAIGRIPEPGTGIPESIIAAKGDLLTGTANDTPAVLTVGANGTTLVADSSEATGLKWATPAAGGGGMTLLSTTTLSGSSTTISSISGSYTDLSVRLIDGTTSSDGTEIYCRINGDTSTSNYVSLAIYTYDSLSEPYGITNQSFIRFQNGTTSTTQKNKANSVINMLDYTSTGTKFMNFSSGVIKSTPEKNMQSGIGVYVGSSAISSLTFLPFAGTLSGTVKIYGVK